MAQNRTSKMLRRSFKSNTNARGYVSKNIIIQTNERKENNSFRQALKNDGEIRREIQEEIRKLVENKTDIEEIKEFLNQERYKKNEQYFEVWIESWIINLNPDIKSSLKKLVNLEKQEDEIVNQLKEKNMEIFNLYGEQIRNSVKRETEKKEREKRKKDEKLQNEER